ncbi:MAG: hypothetical protein ACI841_000352 [Planctomycetota bacterium]|jgi:hypothetical protein
MNEPGPARPDWNAFALGELTSDRLEALARRMGESEDCTRVLNSLDMANVLVDELPDLSERDRKPLPTPPPELLDVVGKAALGEARSAVVDSGRMLEKQLERGPTHLGRFELQRRLDSGRRGRHFSGYPYPFPANGGPRDCFEEEALSSLIENPSGSYYRYTVEETCPVLRYARARIMGPSCVACHNDHPESPKTNWKVGDVRGVLEVVPNLDRDEARIRSGLRGTFLLIGATALSMLALGISVHRQGLRRRQEMVRGRPR